MAVSIGASVTQAIHAASATSVQVSSVLSVRFSAFFFFGCSGIVPSLSQKRGAPGGGLRRGARTLRAVPAYLQSIAVKPETKLKTGLFFFQVLWLTPVLMLLGGLFGNTLYYRKVRYTVRDIAAQPQKARQAQLARRGGVSLGAAVLVGVLLLLLCWWWAFFFSGMPALVAVRG